MKVQAGDLLTQARNLALNHGHDPEKIVEAMQTLQETGLFCVTVYSVAKRIEARGIPQPLPSDPDIKPIHPKQLEVWPGRIPIDGRKTFRNGRAVAERVGTTPRVLFHNFEPRDDDLPPWIC